MEGLTGSSNALEVAQKYGLPSEIIKYARFLKNQAKTEEEELIERLEFQLNENARKGEELEKLISENNEKSELLKKEERQIQHQKNTIHDKAEKEAKLYLDQTIAKANAILKNIREREKDIHYHEALNIKKNFDNILENDQEVEEDLANHEYKIGDYVNL